MDRLQIYFGTREFHNAGEQDTEINTMSRVPKINLWALHYINTVHELNHRLRTYVVFNPN